MIAPAHRLIPAAIAVALLAATPARAQSGDAAARFTGQAQALRGQFVLPGVTLDRARADGGNVLLRFRVDTAYEMIPSQDQNAARTGALDLLATTLCRDAATRALFRAGGTMEIQMVSKDNVQLGKRQLARCEENGA